MILPDAFAPTSSNNQVFKPIPIFVNEEGYSMQIFNRWGQKVFETERLDEGWDGTYQGQQQPTAVYVYLIKYLNEKGEEQIKKGTVALIW